jgi:hypothetical protein
MTRTTSVIGVAYLTEAALFDVQQALDNLGIEYEVTGDNARSICPMHEALTGKQDSHPSWFIHLETGQHHCFSCGYRGGLLGLVADLKEFKLDTWGVVEADYESARKWLRSTGNEIPIEILKNKLNRKVDTKEEVQIEESHLAIFTDPPQWALAARNVSARAVVEYGVLWEEKHGNWILPLRKPYIQKLLGYQIKGQRSRFFRNYPAGLKKSSTLFGVHQLREDQAIVVESPLDCLRIYDAGYPGAVATCGALVSDAQAKLLRATDKVIVAFDNPNVDTAGKKACDDMLAFSQRYNLNLYYFNYGDSKKKDPGDMTDEEIRWGIENAKSVILGKAAYVYGDVKALSN